MSVEIKHVSGRRLFTSQFDSVRDAVAEAVKAGADLRYSNLRGSNLRGSNLRGSNLRGANLHGSDLRGADLHYSNLHGANLHGANLHGADLHGADLRYSDLRYSNLRYSNLHYSNLHYSNLHGANLHGANLSGANLHGSTGSELAIARTRIIPDGDLIGWKQCYGRRIVKLRIPADARRSHAAGRKCRAEYAEVIEIYDPDGQPTDTAAASGYDTSFIYRPGETVRPTEPFDDNPWNECASGIHFFITRIEAEHNQ
jgi:hypothetical protein